MSANEIELTFIRCPSCKSLMPSTAVKCGMCGFDLGAGDDENQNSEPVKKSRLRQKTFTGTDDDLESPEAYFGNQEESDSEESENTPEESEYIDTASLEKGSRDSSRSNISFGTNESDRRNEVEDTISNEPISESRGLRFSEDLREKKNTISRDSSDKRETSEQSEKDSAIQSAISEHGDIDSVKKKRKRRRKKKRPADEDSGLEESSGSIVKRVTPVTRVSSKERNESTHVSDAHPHSQEISRENNDVEMPNVHPEERPNDDRHSGVVRQEVKPRLGESRMSGKIEDATLVGWFVNYSTNAKGLSFEIRVGRQFVGRQSLRGDDLIIQDSAVSTPHCLLQVDSSSHVMLQDLMSEQGTYIKKNGNSEYERIDSSIQLEHGDRVKLGSYELVICLIP